MKSATGAAAGVRGGFERALKRCARREVSNTAYSLHHSNPFLPLPKSKLPEFPSRGWPAAGSVRFSNKIVSRASGSPHHCGQLEATTVPGDLRPSLPILEKHLPGLGCRAGERGP